METTHKIIIDDARNINSLKDKSIQLMITSPPYPMIKMWDECFSKQNPYIKKALEEQNGSEAFELMHKELDKVWDEVSRVLSPGGIACINIGDATRNINNNFQLFNSHSRITEKFIKNGFQCLPNIIWKKPSNSPNKFMGSGMLPPGAYVTLGHEYILIFRKGHKREFKTIGDKENRNESSFFWEERNKWFSDIWEDLKGVRQDINNNEMRERSAAFPFELVYRIINMFSVKDDWILDPFLGTGTTTIASMASQRNSIGLEIDPLFSEYIIKNINNSKDYMNDYIKKRIDNHINFVHNRIENENKEIKHFNNHHNFKVMTKQEKNMKLKKISHIEMENTSTYKVIYQN